MADFLMIGSFRFVFGCKENLFLMKWIQLSSILLELLSKISFFQYICKKYVETSPMANRTFSYDDYRQKLRQRILDAAMVAFREKGIKAVRMDDIANQLSISKRTLYEIYSNKEMLLYECVRDHDEDMERRMAEQLTPDSTVMDILILFLRMHIEDSSMTNPLFYAELAKYPSVTRYIEERHEKQRSRSVGFMHRGVEEGFFRSDINYQIFNVMIEVFMRHIMDKELYKTIPLTEIFRNVILVMLRGFCTEKGLNVIDNFEL